MANLLHYTGLPLRKGDVAARLVADELDFNLAPLASALVAIIVAVVRCCAGSLHASRFGRRAAIANTVGAIEVVGRTLVVLIRNLGHCRVFESRPMGRIDVLCAITPVVVDVYHHNGLEKARSGGDAVSSVVPMDLYWIWSEAEREGRSALFV